MDSSKESYPTIKDFVIQEAHEKAFEKLVMGLKEYEQEKSRILAGRRDLLTGEFEKLHKDNQAQRRIAKSARINESRMKKMNTRHGNLQQLVTDAERKLAHEVCTDKQKYKPLMKQLILEGLIRMLEPVIYIRCVRRDSDLVAELIPECKKAFQEIVRKENMDESIADVDLRLDDRYSLILKNVDTTTERIKKSEESNTCFGGVVMTNEDGLIVCKNTLDARLELAYQMLLPSIRTTLYS